VYKIEDEQLENTKEIVKEKEDKNTEHNNKVKEETSKKCSVEKIIKMKEIGLSLEEIKRICE
jgi:DNA-binding transcriptional regulator YhcF (GntR family)